MSDIVFNSYDICSNILKFMDRDYIFSGIINKTSRSYYIDIGTFTNLSACFSGMSRFTESNIEYIYNMQSGSCDSYLNKCGSIDIIKYSIEKQWNLSLNTTLENAIRTKNEDMENYLRGRKVGPACMIAAVESGDIERVMRYCDGDLLGPFAQNFLPTSDYGYIPTISIRERKRICKNWKIHVGTDYLIPAAIKVNSIAILKWLVDNGIQVDEGISTRDGIVHGNRDLVLWMLEHKYTKSASDIPLASGNTTVKYLQWLKNKGFHIDKNATVFPRMGECIKACAYACRNSSVDVLLWMISNGYAWDDKIAHEGFIQACLSSNVELIKNYFIPQGFKWPIGLPSYDNTEFVKWCHSMGWKWTNKTSVEMCRKHDFSTLRWIKRQNLSMSGVLEVAIEEGHYTIRDWLIKNTSSSELYPGSIVFSAMCSVEVFDSIQFVIGNGYKWDTSNSPIILYTHVKEDWNQMEWVLESGCMLSAEIIEKFIIENGYIYWDINVLKNFRKMGLVNKFPMMPSVINRYDIMEWLTEDENEEWEWSNLMPFVSMSMVHSDLLELMMRSEDGRVALRHVEKQLAGHIVNDIYI